MSPAGRMAARARTTGWRRRAGALGALLAALVAGGVALAVPAQAHAELAAATPAESSRLASAPDSVTLRFSEPVKVDLGYLRVVDHSGARVDTGHPNHPGGDPSAVSVGLRTGLGDGSYVVSWRVVSADSHPVSGAYSFVVGNGPLAAVGGAGAGSGGADGDPTVRVVFGVARWAGFAGLLLLVGGAAFLVLAWPSGRAEPRARRLVWTGWAVAAVSTVLSLPLESLYGSGQGLLRAADTTMLDDTLHITYGRMLSLRLIVLAALALLLGHVLRVPPAEESPDSPDSPDLLDARRADRRDTDGDGERSWQADAGAVLSLGVFATYAASGHAATGIQAPLAVLSDTLHLAAMSTWIGGLAVLSVCLLPRGRAGELSRVLPVFSRIAMVCVGTLVVTGLYQTWREVGTPPALWSTGYGRLLLVKLAGFVLLVGLGYLSETAVRRRFLLPTVRALAAAPGSVTLAGPDPAAAPDPPDEPTARSRLRRSVGLEVLVAAVVLALTAVLINQAPGRQTYTTPFDGTLSLSGGGSVQLQLTPARHGANQVHLFVFDRAGKPVDPRGVKVTAALPQRKLGPLSVTLRHAGVGHYIGSALSLPDPGKWRIEVSVRESEFDESTATATVTVR